MSESKELTLPQRVAALLRSIEREAVLTEMAGKSMTITAITNLAGYQQCHAARMVLKNQRIIIEKDGKAARDEANKFRDAVIAEEKRLIGLIDPEEKRLQGIQDAWDNEKKRIKEAAAEAERQRIATIQARIARIANSPVGVTGKDATAIKAQLTAVEVVDIDDSFAEFKPAAQSAKNDAVATLTSMHAERMAFEEEQVRAEEVRKIREAEEAAERERIAAERIELAKLRTEQEAREKVERDRLAAERAQQEKTAQVERDRIAAEEAAARKRIEDEQRAAREAQAKIEADAKKAREAEEARIAAERKKLADEQEASRQKAIRERTVKQQEQRDEITGLVSAHYQISAADAYNLLQELFA